jgi:hypothetical protein
MDLSRPPFPPAFLSEYVLVFILLSKQGNASVAPTFPFYLGEELESRPSIALDSRFAVECTTSLYPVDDFARFGDIVGVIVVLMTAMRFENKTHSC